MIKKGYGECKVGVIFHRYGPYHICRINSVSEIFQTVGFELSSITKEYKWDKITGDENFERVTIFNDTDSRDVNTAELQKQIFIHLDKHRVDVMLINGWGDKGALIALKWCLKNKRHAILMTEEVAATTKRTWIKEFPKKAIVRLFDAALVGGDAQVRYVSRLGLTKEKIKIGYDVIDNNYFAAKAAIVKKSPDQFSEKYNLPAQFFLTSNRFIAKKNLFRLLEAYNKYDSFMGNKSWKLVMIGDGELKQALQQKVIELNLQDKVIMPGFLQYDTLPDYYALASAFVHASTSEQWGLVVNEAMAAGLPVIVSSQCGCSENLVIDGVNGFVFNAYEVDELADKMIKIGMKSNDELNAMGQMSCEIISQFDPKLFGLNTKIIIDELKLQKPVKKSLLGKMILNLVIKSAAIK